MKKLTVLWVSAGFLFAFTVWMSISISKDLNTYHSKKIEIAEKLNFEERLMDAWEWLPIFSTGEEKLELWVKLDKEATQSYASASTSAIILVSGVFIFLIFNILFYGNSEEKLRAKGLALVCAALAFLYLGLTSPFIEIEAYNSDLAFTVPMDTDGSSLTSWTGLGDLTYEQEFPGRTYYLYEIKSIMGLINVLYMGGNFLIAILVLTVSIIFPIVKLTSSIIIFLFPRKNSMKAVRIVNALGKWSMADVLVAAIFLAFFSYANMSFGVDTGSSTLLGTYFFLLFVLLSIISGTVLKKYVKSRFNKTLEDLTDEAH